VGLLVLDTRGFDRPERVRRAMALTGEFAVQAVAADSPAARAGIVGGEELRDIAGIDLAALPDVTDHSFARFEALTTAIEARLAAQGGLSLSLRRSDGTMREVQLAGESSCRSRIELLTEGNDAQSDGIRAQVSRRYLSLVESDDQLAFLLAHEISHNLLRHRAWLDKVGRKNSNRRITERAADRLAVWLIANAGYDIAQAPAFLEYWGRRQGSPLFRVASHDHWKARQKLVNTELDRIAELRAAHPGEPLDWRERFPR
jgi:hypothetical protein